MLTIHELSYSRIFSAWFFLAWYIIIIAVAYHGFIELIRKFNHPPNHNTSTNIITSNTDDDTLEPVTILRPIKGIDPELSHCLESCFLQNYPTNKLQILFCVDDPHDPSIPIIQSLIDKYPSTNSKILISQHFNPVTNKSIDHYGPNPKVNNLAKGYLHAKHDILWIMDSNVWASPNILYNSVNALIHNTNNGRSLPNGPNDRKVKLVHHVPLALSVSPNMLSTDLESIIPNPFTSSSSSSPFSSKSTSPSPSITSHNNHHHHHHDNKKLVNKKWGSKLDEMFLLTSHSKFYISLNNLSIAPCVNGKSNLYRRSDLDRAVSLMSTGSSPFFNTKSVIADADYYSSLGPGHALELFARYIGEDNMIGIALWDHLNAKTGLTGDFVVQPLRGTDNSLHDYVERRVRWLRVRKYMVLMATLIEPSTESIVCGVFGTYALSTLFENKWFDWRLFVIHMLIWLITDYLQYYTWIGNIAGANYTAVPWLNRDNLIPLQKPLWEWCCIWCLREMLALPIWIIAMVGHEIDWRGRPFKIKKDLTAEEL